MQAWELYNHIRDTQYNKSGFDLDWKIEVDDEEKVIRLLFQASASEKDWIVNILGFMPWLYFPYYFCIGWKKVFDSCRALILEELIREINTHRDYRVEISGHSYGGAMSIIAALELNKVTQLKPDVITFGSPMPIFTIISKIVAKCKLGEVKQYAHWSDIVTYLPPFFGFHNVKVIRLGSFSIKELFNVYLYHHIYGDETIYGGK